ncbi:T9SS type A sorting domain-containing protein, partial [Aequorivita viscosa]|nr:T9SS type A sorting domain-containing protein [Aequorivita viscosa]
MKKNILASLVLALITISLYAQDLNIIWQNTIGGDEEDTLWAMDKTLDGGYIIGGRSESDISGDKTVANHGNGTGDFWILKLDANGNILWQNSIGGTLDDHLYSLTSTADGGYLLGGLSNSNISGDKTENCMGLSDYWVVKIDTNGNVEWDNTIGGDDFDNLHSLKQTPDGGYILGGFSSSNISGDKTENSNNGDIWIVKLNSNGIVEWDNTIGGNGGDGLNNISITNDGGYIIGAESNSNISGDKTEDAFDTSGDYWVLKLDSTGNIQWQNTIGGIGYDSIESISQASDGGYIVSGSSDSPISGDKTQNSNGLDAWIIKLNSSGNIEWQNTIGGAASDFGGDIIETIDGGYLIGCTSNSDISNDKDENSLGEYDIWIVKLTSNGIIEGQNTIGGSLNDGVMALIQNNYGNYFLAGYSNSNISGDKTENSQGDRDYWVLQIDNVLSLEENPFATTITLYPNPTKNTLQLNTQDKTIDQINIYTMTGSKVLQLDAETISPTVDVSSLAAGIYYIQLYS